MVTATISISPGPSSSSGRYYESEHASEGLRCEDDMVQALSNRRFRRRAAAATLSLITVLGGCTDGIGRPARPADSSTVAQTFNNADVKFAQTMIPHYEQAIEMCSMILAKSGIAPEVTQLAQQIKDGQAPQMTTPTGFLTAWNQPLVTDHFLVAGSGRARARCGREMVAAS